SLWENIPGWLTIFAGERKSALTGLILLAMVITFAVLTIVTSIRDRLGRFEQTIGSVAKQADLIRERQALEVEKQQIQRDRKTAAAEIQAARDERNDLSRIQKEIEIAKGLLKADKRQFQEALDEAGRNQVRAEILVGKAWRILDEFDNEEESEAQESDDQQDPMQEWKFRVTLNK